MAGSYTDVPLTPGEEPTPLSSASVPPPASASALRRVLRRARDGVALNVDEAAVAMTGVKPFVSSQPQYSLLYRRPEKKVIPISAANGISQIATPDSKSASTRDACSGG